MAPRKTRSKSPPKDNVLSPVQAAGISKPAAKGKGKGGAKPGAKRKAPRRNPEGAADSGRQWAPIVIANMIDKRNQGHAWSIVSKSVGRSNQACRLLDQYLGDAGLNVASWHRLQASVGRPWIKSSITAADTALAEEMLSRDLANGLVMIDQDKRAARRAAAAAAEAAKAAKEAAEAAAAAETDEGTGAGIATSATSDAGSPMVLTPETIPQAISSPTISPRQVPPVSPHTVQRTIERCPSLLSPLVPPQPVEPYIVSTPPLNRSRISVTVSPQAERMPRFSMILPTRPSVVPYPEMDYSQSGRPSLINSSSPPTDGCAACGEWSSADSPGSNACGCMACCPCTICAGARESARTSTTTNHDQSLHPSPPKDSAAGEMREEMRESMFYDVFRSSASIIQSIHGSGDNGLNGVRQQRIVGGVPVAEDDRTRINQWTFPPVNISVFSDAR